MEQTKILLHGEIPAFLQHSELVKVLNIDEPIEIPLKYYKDCDRVLNEQDLLLYLKTIDYFCLDDQYISQSIYTYIFQYRTKIIKNIELMEYIDKNNEFKYFAGLAPGDIDEHIRIDFCIKNNYFNCFKVLLDLFYPWDNETCILIIKYNKINFLIYLHEFYKKNRLFSIYENFPWSGHTINVIIQYGSLEFLEYAFDHNCIPDGNIDFPFCNSAIISKQYHLLDYLQSRGFKWDLNRFVVHDKLYTNSEEHHNNVYKSVIMQIIVNDVIHGRCDYGLPPLSLNEINARIISNTTIDEIIEQKIKELWVFYGLESLKNLPVEWISQSLYNTTELLINP
jgi:hypothetical protein